MPAVSRLWEEGAEQKCGHSSRCSDTWGSASVLGHLEHAGPVNQRRRGIRAGAKPWPCELVGSPPGAFFFMFSQNSGLRMVRTHLCSKPLTSSAVGIAGTYSATSSPSSAARGAHFLLPKRSWGSPGFLLGPSAPIHLPPPLPPAQGTLSEGPREAAPAGEQCLGTRLGLPGQESRASSTEAKGLFQAHPIRSCRWACPCLSLSLQ